MIDLLNAIRWEAIYCTTGGWTYCTRHEWADRRIGRSSAISWDHGVIRAGL